MPHLLPDRTWIDPGPSWRPNLNISQSAVFQLVRVEGLKLSTLRNDLAHLGARLQLVAVFEEDDEDSAVPIRGSTEGS